MLEDVNKTQHFEAFDIFSIKPLANSEMHPPKKNSQVDNSIPIGDLSRDLVFKLIQVIIQFAHGGDSRGRTVSVLLSSLSLSVSSLSLSVSSLCHLLPSTLCGPYITARMSGRLRGHQHSPHALTFDNVSFVFHIFISYTILSIQQLTIIQMQLVTETNKRAQAACARAPCRPRRSPGRKSAFTSRRVQRLD